MKYRLIIIIFSLVLVTIFFDNNFANAQTNITPSLTISPATFEFEVVAGETLSRQIKVTNDSAVALPVKVRAVNFDAKDETGGIKFITQQDEIELVAYKWLDISPVDFILAPQETQVVDVNINIPLEAVPGGHYVTVLFEPQLPDFYFADEATKIIPVVGTLMLFNVQRLDLIGLKNDSPFTIEEFIMPNEGRIRTEVLVKSINRLLALVRIQAVLAAKDIVVYESVPTDIMLRIKNNDVFHIRPVGSVSVFNIFNKQVALGEIVPTTILPQRVRQVPLTIDWQADNSLVSDFFGQYRLVINAQTNNKTLEEVVKFWVIPWKFILSTVVAFGMFMYFVLKYRRRLIKSFKVLFIKTN